jgi:murein DD-endopeptidase MepM/ murein hydrolase activator NlpD
MTAGDARRSASGFAAGNSRGKRLLLLVAALVATSAAAAQALYKYQDENGDWVYTDRPPADEQSVEVRDLPTGSKPPSVTVFTQRVDRELQIIAHNDYYIHIEVVLSLDELTNVELPVSSPVMRWILDPRSELKLLSLPILDEGVPPAVKLRYMALHGDPRSEHAPARPYRAPFALAGDFSITQAYPVAVTHNTIDSRYAVDIAMPIGTDIHAARSGVVFEVASTNFRGGIDRQRDAPSANIVRILHEDGTHAVYAHLNWNSIRVQPGDEVERGQYIADSGNTGFSSGPHLHFAVLKNAGMRIESVPVTFEGPHSNGVSPAAGVSLTAY